MDSELEELREEMRQTRTILDGLLETVIEIATATRDKLERLEQEIEILKGEQVAEQPEQDPDDQQEQQAAEQQTAEE
jgi:hypothetical protein